MAGVPSYIEDSAKDFATQAATAYKTPLQPSTFMGDQYVAPMDPLQTSAISMAQQGVGSYAPYLQAAQAGLTTAGGDVSAARTAAGGLGALTGAQAYQPFMSPYQTQVIDETMRQYDLSRQAGQQQIRDAAVGAGGFGGGREGAQLGQYDADTLANRAGIQAQLLQQGYGQAQQGAQQHFANQGNIANLQSGLAGQYGNLMNQQLGLGQTQLGLSNFERQGLGADIGAYGQLGAMRQGQTQAGLTAQQQLAQAQAYEPYGRLGQWGSAITGLAGGVAPMQYQQPAQTDPMSSALANAIGIGGLAGKIFG
jgi:hypothetical protein